MVCGAAGGERERESHQEDGANKILDHRGLLKTKLLGMRSTVKILAHKMLKVNFNMPFYPAFQPLLATWRVLLRIPFQPDQKH